MTNAKKSDILTEPLEGRAERHGGRAERTLKIEQQRDKQKVLENSFKRLKRKHTLQSKYKVSRAKTTLDCMHGEVRDIIQIIKSLILAQDERWRRA